MFPKTRFPKTRFLKTNINLLKVASDSSEKYAGIVDTVVKGVKNFAGNLEGRTADLGRMSNIAATAGTQSTIDRATQATANINNAVGRTRLATGAAAGGAAVGYAVGDSNQPQQKQAGFFAHKTVKDYPKSKDPMGDAINANLQAIIDDLEAKKKQKVAGVVSALKTYGKNLGGRYKDIDKLRVVADDKWYAANSSYIRGQVGEGNAYINSAREVDNDIQGIKNSVQKARNNTVNGLNTAVTVGAIGNLYRNKEKTVTSKTANSSDPIKLPLGANGVVFGKGYTRPNVLDTQSNAPNDAGDGRIQKSVSKGILGT